jgi:hypothetical protein
LAAKQVIPIPNSKLGKPNFKRVFEFGSVAEFWRIGRSSSK